MFWSLEIPFKTGFTVLGLLYFYYDHNSTNCDVPPPKHKTLQVIPPLKTPFNNIELQNHGRETQNTMSCSQAAHYDMRTKAGAPDAYLSDPESTSPVIANAANCTSGSTQ